MFLHHDLGVRSEHDLALWTGVAAGASGVTMAIFSPIWGAMADRYGRRSMLIRAILGGAITVGLMGFSQNPIQLVLLRLVQGASSGTVGAATALVAIETPREKVGWSLGILSSSIAFGNALGPFLGGLGAAVFGLRAVFVAGGVLLLLSTLPVIFMVRESHLGPARAKAAPALTVVRSAGAGTLSALVVLMVAQCLLQVSWSASQQLIVLRVLSIVRSGAETVTGTAFGAAGLASAVAAIGYSRLARRSGYLRLVVVLGVVAAACVAGTATTGRASLLIVLTGAFGLLYGAIQPAVSAMIGLETPREVQGRVFGLSSSAVAVGFAIGPLMAGAVAASAGVQVALVVASTFSLAMSFALEIRGREPAAAQSAA